MEKLLDGVEVEWKTLGELGEFTRGNGLQKKDFTESGIPCIHYGQIYTYYGNFAEETKSFVSSNLAKRLKKAQKGDLIIATTSENIEDVCKPLVWLGEDEVCVSGETYVFKHNQNSKYILYYLQTPMFFDYKKQNRTGTKVIRVHGDKLAKFEIPIPPLKVQEEIVRILDTFTELTAELKAELKARKKQYTYYRDKLLSFEDEEVEWKMLGEVFHMQAGKNISSSNIKAEFSAEYKYPCFGGNGVRGYVKVNSHDGEHLLIGRQGALCGNVQQMNGKFYATEHAVVLTAKENIDIGWAFHMLTLMNLNQYATQSAQPGLAVGRVERLQIPIPSIDEQERIASLLDKFYTLTSSITEGLPREIELRQKQYEYYRNMLLSFPKQEG